MPAFTVVGRKLLPVAPVPTFKYTQLDRDGEVRAIVFEHSSILGKE